MKTEATESTICGITRSQEKKDTLRKSIQYAINCVSAENGSDTPDFILAEYLMDCLAAFDKTTLAREKWYGREKVGIPFDHPDAPKSTADHLISGL